MVPAHYVLIVEDDESIRDVFRLALEMDGYKVLQAGNGQEALTVLGSHPKPCLILLDLMMPVMNGWEFATVLERDAALSAIPIVVVTAFAEMSKGIKALGFIKKPIELKTLLATVRNSCGHSP